MHKNTVFTPFKGDEGGELKPIREKGFSSIPLPLTRFFCNRLEISYHY